MCAKGGGERLSRAAHTHIHIYTPTHRLLMCVGGGRVWVHVASPESGWKMPHCAMYECIVSHICMSQGAPELVHQGTAVILPGKKRGITVTSKKNTYQRIHELIGELSGRCIKELPKSHTKQNGVTSYCCPPKKNQKVYEHISEYVSELPGGCVKEPQFSRQKKLVLLSLSNTNIYVYIYIYGHIGTILTSWGDK